VGLAGLAVFGLAAWGAASGRVGSLERAVFHAINGWPDWLYGPMVAVQYLGVLVVGPIVAVAALAMLVTPSLPRRWKIGPWIVVAAVGLARIYLGAHSPLDVVGGTGLGLAIGSGLNLLVGVPAGTTIQPKPAVE